MTDAGDERRSDGAALVATSRALQAVVAAGRRELAAGGAVSAGTWAAIDELHGRQIELLPLDRSRRV